MIKDLIYEIDQKYLNKACKISLKGTCLRKKVGAILIRNPFKSYSGVDQEEKGMTEWIKSRVLEGLQTDLYEVSSAYNTTVTGQNTCEEEGCLMMDGHCVKTIHSEIQCLAQATMYQKEKGWLYITTAPCWKCFQEIAYNNLDRVIFNDDSYWKTHLEFEKHIRELAGKKGIELKMYA